MPTKNISFLFVILPLVFTACRANTETPPGNNVSDTSVETKAPNSNYHPAFNGQTRIAKAKTTTAYTVEKNR